MATVAIQDMLCGVRICWISWHRCLLARMEFSNLIRSSTRLTFFGCTLLVRSHVRSYMLLEMVTVILSSSWIFWVKQTIMRIDKHCRSDTMRWADRARIARKQFCTFKARSTQLVHRAYVWCERRRQKNRQVRTTNVQYGTCVCGHRRRMRNSCCGGNVEKEDAVKGQASEWLNRWMPYCCGGQSSEKKDTPLL